MRLDPETTKAVTVGVLFGSALLFGHAIWPALVEPRQRALPSDRAIRRAERETRTLDALLTTAIAYGAIFFVVDFNIELGRALIEKGELPKDFF